VPHGRDAALQCPTSPRSEEPSSGAPRRRLGKRHELLLHPPRCLDRETSLELSLERRHLYLGDAAPTLARAPIPALDLELLDERRLVFDEHPRKA
jgi:hypothetical protein